MLSILGSVLYWPLKRQLTRPTLFGEIIDHSSCSLPSGHSIHCFILSVATFKFESLSWPLYLLSLLFQASYHLSQFPTLLVLSHLLLDQWAELVGGDKGDEVFAGERWRVRCLFIQQRLLSQRSESLWKRISQSIGE